MSRHLNVSTSPLGPLGAIRSKAAILVRAIQLGIMAIPALVACACPSAACSVINNYEVFFDFGSDRVSTQGLDTLKRAAFHARRIRESGRPPSCESFLITGQADTAEAETLKGRIDLARAEAVQTALEHEGVPGDLMSTEGWMGQPNFVKTGPGVREPQNRNAVVWVRKGEGRLRCDPSTKNERPFPPACIGEYGHCYWELTDGTICNFQNAPDPNPSRYSVIVPP